MRLSSIHQSQSNKAIGVLPDALRGMAEPSEQVIRLLADPDVSLMALCEFVGSNISPIINEAQILESRVYIERRAVVASHRKIVLRVRERRGKYFWIMLERNPTSRRALIMGLGLTSRNDRVSTISSLSQDKKPIFSRLWKGQVSHNEGLEHLVDAALYRLENKQVFNETVTLNELSVVIRAMSDILIRYNLFSVSRLVILISDSSLAYSHAWIAGQVNCWAFCAILQHELGWKASPFFQFGGMLEHKMYAAAQREVHRRVKELRFDRDSFTVSPLHLNLRIRLLIPDLALDTARQFDGQLSA